MPKRMIFAANWKMVWDFAQTITFAQQYRHELAALADNRSIILCPSFPAIPELVNIFKNSPVCVGAQDCSGKVAGAFTGQVSAAHLASAGATYCIIGHSERRRYNHETTQEVAAKTGLALAAGLTPILCVGETADEQAAGKTSQVLEDQLLPVLEVIKQHPSAGVIIAYEPVWAIGTGKIPSSDDIKNAFGHLSHLARAAAITSPLLYGGSVTAANAPLLKKIELLDGFLIGGASLDFQELKNIVEC